MSVEIEFEDNGPAPTSSQVVDGLRSIWPGQTPVFANLQDDGSWHISVPAELKEQLVVEDAPASQHRATIDGRELIVTIRS